MINNVASFTSLPTTIRPIRSITSPTTTTRYLKQQPTSTPTSSNDYLAGFFTGGAFDKEEDAAIKIASRIKSVKDLGWRTPPRRRGSTRPRHRAYGGSTEKPLQLKAGYDESKENCPDKWLTQEEFYGLVKNSGPAADTVFVALAGGGAFAERDVCELKIANWNDGRSFNEDKFLKDVTKGRYELAAGWALFIGVVTASASCIVLPTNPLAKGLESLIDSVRPAVEVIQ